MIDLPEANEDVFADLMRRVKPLESSGKVPENAGKKTLDIDGKSPEDEAFDKIDFKLSEVPVKWFTLASVYWTLKVPFSIPQQYTNELGKSEHTILSYALDFKIMDIPGWQNKVNAIRPEHWDEFCYYLASVGLQKKGQIWIINAFDLPVRDPRGGFFDLTVFTPVCEDVGVCAAASPSGGVLFYKGAGSKQKIRALSNQYDL